MSYHVDPKTQLFDNLTLVEAEELWVAVRETVLHGRSLYENQAFRAWCTEMGYTENQYILLMSTAFPQRALLSLLERSQKFSRNAYNDRPQLYSGCKVRIKEEVWREVHPDRPNPDECKIVRIPDPPFDWHVEVDCSPYLWRESDLTKISSECPE